MNLKKLKFYKQKELLEFKTSIQKNITEMDSVLNKIDSPELIDDFNKTIIYRELLAIDLIKVKRALARKNFLTGINPFIYKREKIAKKLVLLQNISKKRSTNKEFFSQLKEQKSFVIETAIDKLQKHLQRIDLKLKRINNSFLMHALLTLETV